jgi:hypothetical protein
MMLKEVVKRLLEQARLSQWHHDYTATEDYDANLPESLGRREPAPEPGQARYGGTGALGVHPAAATARSEDSTAPRAKG